jgi:KUP system potassium uptake protein
MAAMLAGRVRGPRGVYRGPARRSDAHVPTTTTTQRAPRTAAGAVLLAALGVVFGDIGTSPIYTVQTVFAPGDPHPIRATTDAVFGIVSLIFWSVTIIVTVTYVLLIMRADNNGEGGIMALITLIRGGRIAGDRRTKLLLAALGLFGASLFLGDSMITPAISVLSAVEGLKVAAPSLGHLVVPITAAIIVVLFLLQRLGTATVGRLFGPVMLVWFLAIAALGIGGLAKHPSVLEALSPTYALDFFLHHFSQAFFALAAVVLAVTGAEALYADMGHFGRPPIARAWLALVFPACILSYLGQGALIVDDPANISSPFFLLAPGWAQWPLVFLATAATVIASQAVITGAFSVAQQAVQLGYLPRLRILHTSEQRIGQIYVPWINWLLLVSVLTLVFAFESSSALAFAYGTAVTGTITIGTLLFFYVARHLWRWRLAPVVLGGGFLLGVDLLFLAANLTKLTHGAWLPLLIGVTTFTVLTTWQRGRQIVTRRRDAAEGPLRAFIDEIHDRRPPVLRPRGTAVFLNRGKETAPLAMRASVEHLNALNENVVILTLVTVSVPHVPAADRLAVDDLGYGDDGIIHATARFGYADRPHVPSVIRQLEREPIECRVRASEASYFLSTIDLTRGESRELSRWRKTLFLATSRITADAAEYFGLPRDRTVIIGSRIEV